MSWMWANCCPLFVPTLAVTLCELCMPEAFCGLETVRQKCSVNSVCSVREKTPQRFVCVLYHTVVAFFFSQKNTDEQNTRYFTETLSQPISQNLTANRGLTPSPSPNGEGSDHRVTPIYSPILSSPVWVTSHTTPLSIRRGARGEASRGWG